jgi:hypothetical protein
MAKLVTVVANVATVTLSASLFGAIANCVSITTGGTTNTNVELFVASCLAQGLRQMKDDRLGHGQATDAGLTHSYIESNVKANSE